MKRISWWLLAFISCISVAAIAAPVDDARALFERYKKLEQSFDPAVLQSDCGQVRWSWTVTSGRGSRWTSSQLWNACCGFWMVSAAQSNPGWNSSVARSSSGRVAHGVAGSTLGDCGFRQHPLPTVSGLLASRNFSESSAVVHAWLSSRSGSHPSIDQGPLAAAR
jgi:hypothetical protein